MSQSTHCTCKTTRVLLYAAICLLLAGCLPASTLEPASTPTSAATPRPTLTPVPTVLPPPPAPDSLPPPTPNLERQNAMMAYCDQLERRGNGGEARPQLTAGILFALIEKHDTWEPLNHSLNSFFTSDPDEAQYVLCVRESEHQVGTYSDGEPGYRVTWEVILAKWPEGSAVRSTLMSGDDPGYSKMVDGPGYGRRPFEEMMTWVNQWETGAADSRLPVAQVDDNLHSCSKVVFTPDGSGVVVGGVSGDLWRWDLQEGDSLINLTFFSGEARAIAITPDGSQVAFITRESVLTRLNLPAGEQIASFSTGHLIPDILFLSHDGMLAVITYEDRVEVVDTSTNAKLLTFTSEIGGLPVQPALTSDGTRLVVAMTDGGRPAAVTFDLSSGLEMKRQEIPETSLLLFMLGQEQLAVITSDREVYVWDAGGNLLSSFQLPARFGSPTFSPDGSLLAIGDAVGRIFLWEVATGTESDIHLSGHPFAVSDLQFSPNGDLLASCSYTQLLIWSVR